MGQSYNHFNATKNSLHDREIVTSVIIVKLTSLSLVQLTSLNYTEVNRIGNQLLIFKTPSSLVMCSFRALEKALELSLK